MNLREKGDQDSSKRLDCNQEFETTPETRGEAGLTLLKAIRVAGKSNLPVHEEADGWRAVLGHHIPYQKMKILQERPEANSQRPAQ